MNLLIRLINDTRYKKEEYKLKKEINFDFLSKNKINKINKFIKN
ncbi:hypothetical protein [Spiroplasma citri]|nr:hypothetical protein [Spiroplasma citri]